jgi:hypothetical protein
LSYHQENITWQSENLTWNIGFFNTVPGANMYEEDYDPEWDDYTDYTSFFFASTGHPTADAANASWKGVNPGSHTIQPYNLCDVAEVINWDAMAVACNKETW